MQALCQWEVQGGDSADALVQPPEAQTDIDPATRDRAANLAAAFLGRHKRIDQAIASALHRWTPERLSPVERNVLRVAVTELLIEAAPPKVVLNEAIEIGREYGGADTPRFINGVLDKIRSDLDSAGREPATGETT